MTSPASDYEVLWQRMSQSPHFPIYHYVPGNWISDPKLFFWNSEYHVFLQHNPNGPFWGTMHWGAHGQDGCFTGSVVFDGDQFRIFYTGIPSLEPFRQTQCMASSADLITWDKYQRNPLMIEKPDGFGPCWRDPCVWQEADAWYMMIGGERLEGRGGVVFLCRSTILLEWEYVHVLHHGRREEVEGLSSNARSHHFECPDLFALADKHVLLTTHAPQTFWQVGSYRNHRFELERIGVMDGGGYCSAKTLIDDRGRRIAWGFLWPGWGWIREPIPVAEKAGFSGVLSLPRELSILPDGSLGIEPVSELEALRGRRWQFDGDDLIYLVRTAHRGAHNYHDSNRITFHRLAGFRQVLGNAA